MAHPSPAPTPDFPSVTISPVATPATPPAPIVRVVPPLTPAPVSQGPATPVPQAANLYQLGDVPEDKWPEAAKSKVARLEKGLREYNRKDVRLFVGALALVSSVFVGGLTFVNHKKNAAIENLRIGYRADLATYTRNADKMYLRATADHNVRRNWQAAREVIQQLLDKDIGDIGPESAHLQYNVRAIILNGDLNFSEQPDHNRGIIFNALTGHNQLVSGANEIEGILQDNRLVLTDAEKASLRNTATIMLRYARVLEGIVTSSGTVFATTAVPLSVTVTESTGPHPAGIGWVVNLPDGEPATTPVAAPSVAVSTNPHRGHTIRTTGRRNSTNTNGHSAAPCIGIGCTDRY